MLHKKYLHNTEKNGNDSRQIYNCVPLKSLIVTDFYDKVIHMLNQDGKFLRYIVPSGAGMEKPRAVCMIGDDELIVGEEMTG